MANNKILPPKMFWAVYIIGNMCIRTLDVGKGDVWEQYSILFLFIYWRKHIHKNHANKGFKYIKKVLQRSCQQMGCIRAQVNHRGMHTYAVYNEFNTQAKILRFACRKSRPLFLEGVYRPPGNTYWNLPAGVLAFIALRRLWGGGGGENNLTHKKFWKYSEENEQIYSRAVLSFFVKKKI